MAYLEEREKNGKKYYYAKESYRAEGRVKTRTLAYLGTNKKSAEKKLAVLNNPPLLTEKEQEIVNEVKRSYKNFWKSLDKNTREDVMKNFTILFTNETNRIEGSTFTLKETRLLLEDNITPQGKNLREVYEQINTKKLFEAHKKKPFAITEKDIIRIHTIFMQDIEKRTGYRTRPARILGSATKITPPEHIKTDMKLLLDWYEENNVRLGSLELAAVFHAKFEQIHPFADGNGRVGRFLTYVMMEKEMPILFPKRERYLNALETSQNKPLGSTERKDFDSMIKYFVRAHESTWNGFFSRI